MTTIPAHAVACTGCGILTREPDPQGRCAVDQRGGWTPGERRGHQPESEKRLTEKVCLSCHELLPIEAFHRSGEGRGGVSSWCRTCKAADTLARKWAKRMQQGAKAQ